MLISTNWPDQIVNLFEIEIESIDNEFSLRNSAEIGRWLSKNSDSNYFPKPTYDTETYFEEEYKKLPKKPGRATDIFGSLYSIKQSLELDDESDYKLETIEKKREYVDGFEYTAESPFRGLRLIFKPKYSSIENYALTIALIFSRKDLVFFVAQEVLPYKSWENIESLKCLNWKTKEVLLKKREGNQRIH